MKDIEKQIKIYHESRPEPITTWLENIKHISQWIQDIYLIGFNDKTRAITIPVRTKDGSFFFKYRADPRNKNSKLRYWCSEGANHDLYPRDILESKPSCLYIVEGELKALTLIDMGYPAICGTGGAATIKDSWIDEILSVTKKIIIVPDNDAAGKEGAIQWALKLKQR